MPLSLPATLTDDLGQAIADWTMQSCSKRAIVAMSSNDPPASKPGSSVPVWFGAVISAHFLRDRSDGLSSLICPMAKQDSYLVQAVASLQRRLGSQ